MTSADLRDAYGRGYKFIKLFPPELRTASIVPRWSVVWTLTQDSVANHSFYVPFYAEAIGSAVEWLVDWAKESLENTRDAMGCWMALSYMARTHDLPELGMGDIVSPVKKEIIDRERFNQYELSFMQEKLTGIYDTQSQALKLMGDRRVAEMWTIIKAADRLDALLFLIGEQRMGNGVVSNLIRSAEDRLRAAWYELPVPDKYKQPGAEPEFLEDLWHTVMLPVIAAHREQGGQGV